MRFAQECLDRCADVLEVYASLTGELVDYQHGIFSRLSDQQRTLTTETLRVLTSFQLDRHRSAYCLIVNQMAWDAEIIVRSIYECCSKIVYIGAHHEPKRSQLVSEYWNVLPSIYDKRISDNALAAQNLSRRLGGDSERVFSLLRDPSVFDLDAPGNRKYRNEVEQRWSFSAIVHTLVQRSDEHIPVPGLDDLKHMYGMASHIAHASPKAFDLFEDRLNRTTNINELEAGHLVRILSDMISLACFSLQFSEFATFGHKVMQPELRTIFEKMSASTKVIQAEFARSQDQFYESYR